MTTTLTQDVIDLLNDESTFKVLTTVDAHGVPHAVFKQSMHLGPDGHVHLLELIESSNTARNLTGSIWFDRTVSILLRGAGGRSVQIKGRVTTYHISGPLFEQHYLAVRKRLGDVDLAGIWVIEPDQVLEQDLQTRRAQEEALHPGLIHLDRIAVH